MMSDQQSSGLAEHLNAEIAERLAMRRLTIPVLPTVATQIVALTNDTNADFGKLADTIRSDQAIAGHIMKFANSPLLRTGAPIVSLQQAIARLGMRSIADIAFAACMGPKLFKAPEYARLIDLIWNESLATAIWAREIARRLRRNVEVSFLCGLMHQIGKPVVLQAVQEILRGSDQVADDAILQSVLTTHARPAGIAVAAAWHLPELVAETIAHLDDFRAAGQAPELVATIAAARAFSAAMLADAAASVDALVEHPEMAEINLYRSDIEELLGSIDAVKATVRDMAL